MAASRVTFTNLYGTSKHEPLCSLLRVDDVNILLDCGWNESFNEELLAPLKQVAPEVDIVLISHADLEHCGALPYAVTKLGLTTNIFLTEPIQKLASIAIADAYISASSVMDIRSFTIVDVDTVFSAIKAVRWEQETDFRGVKLTALKAGRTIGGAIWRICKLLEDIVYAVDYNPKNDLHLNRAVLADMKRPTVLITDAYNVTTEPFRAAKENDLIETVIKAMGNGGNVLIPSDTCGRVLELAFKLDSGWPQCQRIMRGGYMPNLYILSNVGSRTFEIAKSLVPFLNDRWSKQFDAEKTGPFSFRFARAVTSLDEIRRDVRPKVVLASLADMDVGMSKDLFLEWCSVPVNMLLVTSRGRRGSLASVVRKERKRRQEFVIDVKTCTRSMMVGDELTEWLANARAGRDREARDLEIRRRMERERLELESEAKVTGEEEEVSKPSDDLEDGQVPLAQANARSYLFDVRYAMFSCDDDDAVEVTPFGLALDVDMLGTANAVSESSTLDPSSRGLWSTAVPAAPAAAQPTTGPFGLPLEQKTVIEGFVVPPKFSDSLHAAHVRCGIEFLDMDGRADKQSVFAIIEAVAPITTVILHGSLKGKKCLQEKCAEHCSKVLVPAQGSTMEVSSRTVMFEARIWDDVYSGLKFQQVGPLEAGYVDAVWDGGGGDGLSLRQYLLSSEGHRPVYLRKEPMKLRELQRKVVRDVPKIEFQDRTLVTPLFGAGGPGVRVRESGATLGSNALHLEGTLSDEFYKVRDAIYAMHSAV